MSRVELARQAVRSRAAMRPRGPSLTTVLDLTVAESIAARLYRPTTKPAPFVLFFHGGGFVLGDLDNPHPNADMALSMASVKEKGDGWGLDADQLTWFVEQWVPDPARRSAPDVSPLHAPLDGLPPTLLVTAEHDPLRDEGIALAIAIRAAGSDVVHLDYPGLRHGFVGSAHESPDAARATAVTFEQFGRLIRGRVGSRS